MEPLAKYMNEAQYTSPWLDIHQGKRGHKIFVVIKPGFLDKATAIVDKFKRAGFEYKQWRTKHLTMGEAKRMYYVHKDEDFYYPLCKYMSSGPCMGIIFEWWGEGDVFKTVAALKDKIREQFGVDDMRNCLHSSDNAENMAKEASIFF